jgi:hypothetical protein
MPGSMIRGSVPVVAVLAAASLLGACRTAVNLEAVRDAQVAAQVKTALVNDPALGSMPIAVSVVQGVARLSGTVGTRDHADRAAALAGSVPGVRAVQVHLQVDGRSGPTADVPPTGQSQLQDDLLLFDDDPRLLALGASLGWSGPRTGSLGDRVTIGPLVRLGSGQGLGLALALNWFQTRIADASGRSDAYSRIHVRPIMAGLSYTLAADRLSVSPSIVGGIAFNSVSVRTTGPVDRIAVEVRNSLVWRPGVSIWIDVSRRAALNFSAGYMVTGLAVTFLEEGRLVRRSVRGDTTVLHVGAAYKVF